MYNVEIKSMPCIKLIGIERKIGTEEGPWDVFSRVYDDVFKNATHRVYPNSHNGTHGLSTLLPEGGYHYFVGIEVSDLSDIPNGAVSKIIPEMMFAIIKQKDGINYHSAIDFLYREWFEANIYQTAHLEGFPCCAMEYYTPNQDFPIYEEHVYIPIKQFDCEEVEIPDYKGMYFRSVKEDRASAKKEAFDVMLKWVKDNDLHDIKFEVRYGELSSNESFCEITYKLFDGMKKFSNNDLVKTKLYKGGSYITTLSIHHFLEPSERAFYRWIENNGKYTITGGCYEEYMIKNGKLNLYTPITLYEGVKTN